MSSRPHQVSQYSHKAAKKQTSCCAVVGNQTLKVESKRALMSLTTSQSIREKKAPIMRFPNQPARN